MDRSQTIGMTLMAIAGLQMLVFAVGVLRRSYLAVAVPVLAAVAIISGLLFWIGYTMVTIEPDLAELDLADEEPPT